MHPVDIRSMLKKAGYTAAKIAADIGITGAGVRQVLDGVARSQRVEARISEITNLPLYELWPKWHKRPPGVITPAPPGAIDIQTLGIIEQHLDRELMARIPELEAPFVVRVRHLAMIYNSVLAHRSDELDLIDTIASEVQSYVDMHDDPEGPGLQRVFLRNFSGAQATVTKERATERSVTTGAVSGKQINMTGDHQSLVLGSKIKKQKVVKP